MDQQEQRTSLRTLRNLSPRIIDQESNKPQRTEISRREGPGEKKVMMVGDFIDLILPLKYYTLRTRQKQMMQKNKAIRNSRETKKL